jgi:hypothetical protein
MYMYEMLLEGMTACNYYLEYGCCNKRGVEVGWIVVMVIWRLDWTGRLELIKVERAVEQFQPRVVIRMPYP